MKKSQIKTLSILAAAVVVLSALLIGLSWEPPEKPMPELIPFSAEEITSFSYQTVLTSLSFEKQNDSWVLKNDPNFPVNSALVDEMLQVLCSTVAQDQLSDVDPEGFGLTAPQCVIEAMTANNGATILIGSMNAVTDQLYVQVGPDVYLTDTSLLQAFSGSQLDLAQPYTIPRPDNHESLTIMNDLGSFTLSCVGSQTGGADGKWRVRVGETWVDADPDLAYNFYFLTWDMHWKSVVGYVTDNSQLSVYGLDTPQVRYTLTYGGEVFHLILGTSLPDGTTYAMCADSNLVYTIDSILVQWLSQATAQSVLSHSQ